MDRRWFEGRGKVRNRGGVGRSKGEGSEEKGLRGEEEVKVTQVWRGGVGGEGGGWGRR